MAPMTERNPTQDRKYSVIKVENFGPIERGEVELRPLTVFTGPSNTGKSWLAILLYALLCDLPRKSSGWRHPFRRMFRSMERAALQKFPEEPDAWIASLEAGKPVRLTASDRQLVLSYLQAEGRDTIEEILRCFGLSNAAQFVRESDADSAKVEFRPVRDAGLEEYASTLEIGKEAGREPVYSVTLPEDLELLIDSEQMRSFLIDRLEVVRRFGEAEESESAERRAGYFSMLSFVVTSLDPGRQPVWYLPADRGGVMRAHHAVVSALIQRASRAALRQQPSVSTLSGILSDFLENLIELAQKRHTERRPIATSLEEKVIGGSIDIEGTEIDYPRFSWTPDGWDRSLPLLSVSSMVSELAPVALYLKHLVSEGDLLIFEEPEAHLHPAKQVALVQEVANWVKRGVQVVLTTHSEWILEALSNLVGEGEKGLNEGLRAEDVGLWQFDAPDGQGTHIRKIDWSEEEGGYATGYEDVAVDLHNKWADLVGGGA